MGVGSLPGTSLVLQPRMARLRPSLTEKRYRVCPPSLWLCCLDGSLNSSGPQLAHL